MNDVREELGLYVLATRDVAATYAAYKAAILRLIEPGGYVTTSKVRWKDRVFAYRRLPGNDLRFHSDILSVSKERDATAGDEIYGLEEAHSAALSRQKNLNDRIYARHGMHADLLLLAARAFGIEIAQPQREGER